MIRGYHLLTVDLLVVVADFFSAKERLLTSHIASLLC